MLKSLLQFRGFYYLGRIDWILILLYLFITFFGVVAIYNITPKSISLTEETFLFKHIFIRQLFWIGISLLLGLVILMTNSKIITSLIYSGYIVVLFLMLITVFFGTEVRGSKTWLSIFGLKVQVVEFCKIITILALAKYLSTRRKNIKAKYFYLKAICIIFIPILLTVLQKEVGVGITFLALVFVFLRNGLNLIYLILSLSFVLILIVCLTTNFIDLVIITSIMLVVLFAIKKYFISYFRKKYLYYVFLILIGGSILSIQTFVLPYFFQKILKPHQVNRIVQLFGSDNINTEIVFSSEKIKNLNTANFDNYNVTQSKIAIGSGGFLGRGTKYSMQTSLDFVPEQSTDFIFCFIAEAFGFAGSLFFIALITFFVIRIFTLAEKQRSMFSTNVGYGLASLLFFHYIINISMTIGVFPVIGITLPFVSYGGASFVCLSILFFVFLRLHIDKNKLIN